MNNPTLTDRLVTTLKNNRAVAVALVIVAAVIGGAQFTGALHQLASVVRPGASHSELIYRALLADLSSTETALDGFSGVSLDETTIAAQAQIPLTAGEPVCGSQGSRATQRFRVPV